MIENQNAGVTQKKKKYGRLKGFICFSVAAFISFSQVSPIWAAEGTRVFDEAGLFSAEEVQELETRIDEVRDSQDADLAVLTVEDAQGESAESYADDFYDSHGLGVGDDASGILLSIDMDNREIYVSTTGYAMKVLTDARVEKHKFRLQAPLIFLSKRRLRAVLWVSKQACQNTHHISIQRRSRQIIRDRRNCPGCITSDARKFQYLIPRRRHLTAVVFHQADRCLF